MGTELSIPFAGQKPAAAFASLPQESLAEGIGSSYGVIGYKGKVWSLRYRGERHTFIRPDDGTPSSYLDVIILRQAHNKAKSYYLSKEEGGGYQQEASEGKRPVCASLDGVTPDPDVMTRQADHCAICPRNVWKVNAEGRKGRECTDYKRLAVLVLPTQTKAILGAPLMEPVFLRIPPDSLNDLAVFGEGMSGQGWHMSSFVTRISFDPEKSHPKMVFRPQQALTDAEAPVVLPLREDPMSFRITGEDQIGKPRPLAVAAPAPSPATPAPVAPTPPVQPVVTPPTATVTELAPATTANVAASPSEPMGTGLLELTANPPGGSMTTVLPPKPAPAVQTAEDTGEPVESDDAIDAKIKSLFPTA